MGHPNFATSKSFASAVAVLALAGCATTEPRTVLQRVNVPVPLECQGGGAGAAADADGSAGGGRKNLDQFAHAAMAEMERREGYETLLRAALAACETPVLPISGAVPKGSGC